MTEQRRTNPYGLNVLFIHCFVFISSTLLIFMLQQPGGDDGVFFIVLVVIDWFIVVPFISHSGMIQLNYLTVPGADLFFVENEPTERVLVCMRLVRTVARLFSKKSTVTVFEHGACGQK